MADRTPQDVMAVIDQLLARRQQYEEWIARLDAASGGAPDAVRNKVREDYQSRLEATLQELREHQGAIADQLADLRIRQDELSEREREVTEALAEAELRHAVGEYDDRTFEKNRKESDRSLGETRSQLEKVAGEISRLADVQGLIAPPAPPKPAPRAAMPPPPPPPAPKPPVREPEITVPDLLSQLPPPAGPPASTPSAPRFEPRPVGGKGPEVPPRTIVLESERRTPPNDELAFLKSVSEESKPARTESKAAAPAPSAPAALPAAGAATGARTLKCAECGAMNRPTEWYCEKCGAELAAL
ncbi:MAG: hypothetical protein ACREMH_09725 [Gemmatimonadales bacterium]